ncbi:MAG: hypothetical protein L6R35_003520 [Caloplaca aegaea]|nr:MAG: hypothetical protein L6R35_003520 [Caloplaca aegaea]
MLYGVQDDLPVRYDDPNSAEPIYLRSGDSRVMYAKSNLFSVGGLQYRLVFAPFNRQQYLNFVQQRNHMMQTCGLKAPHHALSAVNRREDTRRGLVVTHGTMGRGGYGWIYSGVDVVTGRPLAIKEHKPIKASYMEPITNEVNLGRMFNETHGLLPIFNDWCEHRLDDVCNKFPQAVYTSSPLAICDFWKVEWVKANVRDAIQAFHGPLQGLATLHAHGFIHRDVHRGNLFLMSVHPPVSLLGDFGKVIKAEVHQDSNLGPRDTRAPEVDGRTWYTNKIDIWSMGYAMVMCIALPSFPYPQPFDLQIWHREAMDFLDSDIDPSDDDKKAMDLIRCMLAWDPSERISAAEALRHDAFLPRLPSPTPASAPQHFQTGNLQSLHAQPPPPQSHPSDTRLSSHHMNNLILHTARRIIPHRDIRVYQPNHNPSIKPRNGSLMLHHSARFAQQPRDTLPLPVIMDLLNNPSGRRTRLRPNRRQQVQRAQKPAREQACWLSSKDMQRNYGAPGATTGRHRSVVAKRMVRGGVDPDPGLMKAEAAFQHVDRHTWSSGRKETMTCVHFDNASDNTSYGRIIAVPSNLSSRAPCLVP